MTTTPNRSPPSVDEEGLPAVVLPSPLTSSPSVIRVSFINEDTGVGSFASRAYARGDCVLRERPYVFAQSYRTWDTQPTKMSDGVGNGSEVAKADLWNCSAALSNCPTSSHACSSNASCSLPFEYIEAQPGGDRKSHAEYLQRVRCCFGCGAPLPQSLREECERLDGLFRLQRNCWSDDGGNVKADATRALWEDSAISLSQESKRETSLWELVCITGISRYLDASTASNNATSTAACSASRAYVTEVDVTGAVHIVFFCSPTCEAQSLNEDGKRFVLRPLVTQTARRKRNLPGIAASPFLCCRLSKNELEALRYPTYGTILREAEHPTPARTRGAAWPTRLSVLSTLHSISRRCNERVWLLVLLLAKELHRTLSVSPPPSSPDRALQVSQEQVKHWLEQTVAVKFERRLDDVCERYAEGAMQILSADQKALLRFSWKLLTWWWVLCCLEVVENRIQESREYCSKFLLQPGKHAESEPILTPLESLLHSMSKTTSGASAESLEKWLSDVLRIAESIAFPLQRYLQLYWLTNANAHMYVVTSSLYSLWCHWLADVGPSPTRSDGAAGSSGQSAEDLQAAKLELFSRLNALFNATDAWPTTMKSEPAASLAPSPTAPEVLHPTGVALYSRATKLNHSCVPNVCFQPNMGAVEASVVAVRNIEVGEEIYTSYILPEQFGETSIDKGGGEVGRRAAAKQRRLYLQIHYGFVCKCPLCADAVDDDGNANR
ncbi:hypothetical protein ABL78_1673 [Leptomonas seymouri]|uniref:SET domain-containing protein n=1 Tax=Leptomonas seymouri TaxID=5684 RepID=A0A0N1I099_LEPSE|nr:hypothetical protein ABL78_1673 [Leptomonas seymouri]|eukprot:KPI89181.1 hypothetical protein ABL78_1673 [Leptomonas seymouri]